MATHELSPEDGRIEIQGAEGFTLRQLVLEDSQRYFDLIDVDREHFKHGEEITPNKYPDVEAVRRSIEDPDREKLRFGIWDGDVMVGSINLTHNRPGAGEVGYWVGGEHIGHGYARRALELLVNYSFNDLKLQRLNAWVAPENAASLKTLEKVGFRKLTEHGPQIFYGLTPSQVENT